MDDLTLGLAHDPTLRVSGGLLGVNLSNSNLWMATQVLPTTDSQGSNLISAINAASSSTIDAARLDATVITEGDIGTGLGVTSGVLSNSGVLSVTGTTNEIIATPTTGHVVVSLPETIDANIMGTAATATWAVTAHYADTAGTAGGVSNTTQTGNTIIQAINIADSNIAPWALDPSVLLQTEVVGTTDEIDVNEAGGILTLSLPTTINANAVTADYADSAGVANRVTVSNLTGNTVINAINVADSVIAPWALDPTVLLQTEVIGTTNEIDVNEAGGILTLSLPPTINADLNGNAVTADYADSAGVANAVTINNLTGNTIINAINIADSVIAPWALDPSVLLQTEVIGTTNEIDVNEAGGILTLSLPPTINADLNGNALTADYADSAGKAGSIAVTQEMGNTIINAINMADSNIHYWALDETVLLQTEVLGTPNEIDVNISGNNVVLSLPGTVNANINGNATTATTALSTNYADTAGVANRVANTSIAGGSIIDALTSNGDTLTNSIFGTSSNVTGVVIEMHGGTGISSYTKGDVIFADTTNSLATLPIGSENQVLYVNSGRPQWGSVPAAGSTPYAIYPTIADVDSAVTFTLDSAIVSSSTVIFLSASSTTNPQILLPDGTSPGQLLILMSQMGSDHFHIHDSWNINIPNPNQFAFQEHGDNITLLWCGMEWIEVARADIN